MSFSEVFRVEKNVFKFSLDGKYIAYAFHNNVFIRNVQCNKIIRSFSALGVVQDIEWSLDSKFIICGLYLCGIIQVISLQHPKWKCKIRECDVGIRKAMWSPDSRHILTIGKFNVWVCIWSLSDLSVKYIYNLKSLIDSVAEFSQDGKWLAVLEQQEKSCCVAVFSAASWSLSKRYPCDKIDFIGGLSWSPDSSTICVWERRVNICRVLLVSLFRSGIYTFERNCLGIKTLSWSPSGQFLSLGCYDGKIRLINNVTWNEMMVFEHRTIIDSTVCSVFKEVIMDAGLTKEYEGRRQNGLSCKTVFKEVTVRPMEISVSTRTSDDVSYHCGVWINCFSSCGHFLVSSCEIMPATLWIWNIRSSMLHTFLSFNQPVVDVAWDPSSLQLAAVSLTANVCLWSPAGGASVVQAPESELWDMCVSGLKWHHHGHTLALSSKNIMALLWFAGD